MIKVLLFDFYGVFLEDAYEAWLISNGLRREGIFAELVQKLDRGEYGEAEFVSGLSKAVGHEVTIQDIHLENQQPNTELVGLVRNLRPTYNICLFSNASPKLRVRLERLGINNLFDDIIISSEIGHAKPSDEAFAVALQRIGAAPQEILFIDDNPVNIEAARRNGLNAQLYLSMGELRQTLTAFGLASLV